ncbi:MAG: A/G-specific adenine glycosylase [Polyangiales bacterium]
MTKKRAARSELLGWFRAHGRDLPWRRTNDPYAIWVSEVMLQQTRVDTVIPYFERFVRKFPTPKALARAREDAVLAAWSGLGYYRRARLLHQGVKEVVATYGGRVPEDAAARLALPGVGRYTAGAIGSIAFGLPEPIVDGNVARVLSRVHGVRAALGTRDSETELWARAAEWVKGPSPGDLNQALMELGATLCTPSAPNCPACPLKAECVARREGTQSELPVPKARKAPRGESWVLVVVTDAKGRVALLRGTKALFGGLWAPPSAVGTGRDVAKGALESAALKARLARAPRGRLRHVLSHRDLHIEVWTATLSATPRMAGLRMQAPGRLGGVGVSTLTKKALALAVTKNGPGHGRARSPA